MRLLAFLSLLPLLARGSPVALDLLPELTTEDIDISPLEAFGLVGLGESPDGQLAVSARDLDPRNVLKRSSDSALVCRSRFPAPPTGGRWLFREATCLYQNLATSKFKVSCQAETLPANIIYRQPGDCQRTDRWGNVVTPKICTQFHGFNDLGAPAYDIFCSEPKKAHRWTVDASRGQMHACSRAWTNLGARIASLDIAVNVLDSTESYSVPAGNVWFQVNGLKTGNERANDAFVGSGKVTVSPGLGVQACVEAQSAGQILDVIGTIKALEWLS